MGKFISLIILIVGVSVFVYYGDAIAQPSHEIEFTIALLCTIIGGIGFVSSVGAACYSILLISTIKYEIEKIEADIEVYKEEANDLENTVVAEMKTFIPHESELFDKITKMDVLAMGALPEIKSNEIISNMCNKISYIRKEIFAEKRKINQKKKDVAIAKKILWVF